MEAAIKSNLPITLRCDLNIDLLQNDHFSIKYLELLQSFHLNQYIENATRFSKFKKSLIDHVVTTPGLEPIKAFPLCYPIADHLPTLTTWHESKVRIETSQPETCKRINYKKLENLLRDRKSTDISSLDSNDSFDSLHDKILSSIDEATYLLPKRLRPKKSWITKETISLCMTVRRLHRKFIRQNSAKNETIYKNARVSKDDKRKQKQIL